MPTNYPTVSAVYDGRTIAPRNLFKSGTPQFLPSIAATIDGTKTRDTNNDITAVLRAGLLMGKVTSGGKWRNSVVGLLNGAVTAGTVTSLTVVAATATEVARLITLAAGNVDLKLIGPPVTAGTVAVQSVTATAASGTTITISSTTLAAAVVGSLIAPADGSQIPTQFITNQYGVDVTDFNGTSQDQVLRLLKCADIDVTQIPLWSSMDASVQAWVKASLRGNGGPYTFSDDTNR